MEQAVLRVRAAVESASAGLVDRREVVELLALAAVARQHVLVLGPPGTAKSELVRRFAAALDARRFEYLLGRFTEPSEIFGPVDLIRLRAGEVVTRTQGMLPSAEIAFLDEVFLGSTAILNTLLGVLNERRYRRGHETVEVPLRLCVGASNDRPETPELAAFGDRFALTAFVEPVDDTLLEDLLESAYALPEVSPQASIADLDVLARAARSVDLGPVRTPYAECIRVLRREGLYLSDRRVVQGQRLLAAAAALAGRTTASVADLWPLVSILPDADGQRRAREVLRDRLDAADNPTLPTAAEAASAGRAARERRLLEVGSQLLEHPDTGEGWRLKLEGVAREIDSSFPEDALPPSIVGLRARIVEALG